MKQQRTYPKVSISPKAERSLKEGHPWVYGEEIREIDGPAENGGLVDVMAGHAYMGTGFYNDQSKITVRLLSRNANERFDEAFWQRRVHYAVDYRRQVMPGEDFSCCRLIHGEADQMPGLTVDRYEDILVAEVMCLGMEKVKNVVYEALQEELSERGVMIRGIYERNESSLREKEGLSKQKGWYALKGLAIPSSCLVDICENGIRYHVDVENGQKTGFFLDQKYNRAAVGRIAKERKVLDLFTHTGSFGLNAAKGGAKRVVSVDISEAALEMARENAALNGMEDKIEYQCADVFELLTSMADHKNHDFDFIILDPPAFTKSRGTVENAERGYREINRRAMQLLPRGGYLATCSCSHFMTSERFKKMLHAAARDASVSLRQIEERRQAPDHPILWGVPETEYLKFYLFQIV